MFLDIHGLTDERIATDVVELFSKVSAERKAAANDSAFPDPGPSPLSAAEMDEVLGKSVAEKLDADAKVKPVATAAQWAVRCLAFQLLAQGGLNRMKDICSSVGEINGRAENWLDHRWNGIGGWWS